MCLLYIILMVILNINNEMYWIESLCISSHLCLLYIILIGIYIITSLYSVIRSLIKYFDSGRLLFINYVYLNSPNLIY